MGRLFTWADVLSLTLILSMSSSLTWNLLIGGIGDTFQKVQTCKLPKGAEVKSPRGAGGRQDGLSSQLQVDKVGTVTHDGLYYQKKQNNVDGHQHSYFTRSVQKGIDRLEKLNEDVLVIQT